MYKLFLAIGIMALLVATTVDAKLWYVFPDGSGDAPTIQAAIDSATTGDNILVEPGTYFEESIVVDGKDISISMDSGSPLISGPTPGSGVGLIIRNVSSTFLLYGINFTDFGSGVVIEEGSPTVWYSTIKHCGSAVTISGATSAPSLSYSIIDSCTTAYEIQQGSGVKIENHTIVNCSSGIVISGGSVTVDFNIISGCITAIECSGGSPTFTCNDLWNNTVNYSGCTPGATDLFDDPIFCFLTEQPPDFYYLHIDSPCWGINNPCGEDLGAYTQTHGCVGTAVDRVSWGAIKEMYR